MGAPRSPFGGPKSWNTRSDLRNVVANVIRMSRNPTESDVRFAVGQLWINFVGKKAWILTALIEGIAFWKLAAVNPSDLETLSGQDGTKVFPDSDGNIQIKGDEDSGILVTADPPNHRLIVSATAQFLDGETTTVGATTDTLLSIAVPIDHSLSMQAIVAGRSLLDGVGGLLSATARNTAGAASLIVTDSISYAVDPGLEGATFEATTSGGNLVLQVTGVVGETIHWSGQATFTSIGAP